METFRRPPGAEDRIASTALFHSEIAGPGGEGDVADCPGPHGAGRPRGARRIRAAGDLRAGLIVDIEGHGRAAIGPPGDSRPDERVDHGPDEFRPGRPGDRAAREPIDPDPATAARAPGRTGSARSPGRGQGAGRRHLARLEEHGTPATPAAPATAPARGVTVPTVAAGRSNGAAHGHRAGRVDLDGPAGAPPTATAVRRGDVHVGRATGSARAAGQRDQLCGAMDVPPVARIHIGAASSTSGREATSTTVSTGRLSICGTATATGGPSHAGPAIAACRARGRTAHGIRSIPASAAGARPFAPATSATTEARTARCGS